MYFPSIEQDSLLGRRYMIENVCLQMEAPLSFWAQNRLLEGSIKKEWKVFQGPNTHR